MSDDFDEIADFNRGIEAARREPVPSRLDEHLFDIELKLDRIIQLLEHAILRPGSDAEPSDRDRP